MEQEGLISRERNPRDRRILNVYLTEEGTRAQEGLEKIFTEVDNKCFKGFSEEEKVQVISYLNRINENLKKGDRELE